MRFGGLRILELFMGTLTVPHLDAQFDALAAELYDADVLFSHSTAALVGAIAADAVGVPWISGDLFPMLMPTETAPPAPNLPSWGARSNRLLWKVARSPYPNRFTASTDLMKFRRSKGLPAGRLSPIDLRVSPHLNIGMASPHYVEPAPDWPDGYELTGFTHWQNDQGEVPGELDEFLAAQPEPPLLITLGTLAASTHPEHFESAIDAADQAGVRTVSLCSMESTASRLSARYPPARHLAVRFAPLSKVLPRVLAVVHSGSHGTNSMSLAAGLPSVIIPSIFDQVWHAKRQEQLGTGIYAPKPKQLASAVGRLVANTSDADAMAGRARRIGQLLAEDDGVGAAADRIEGFLGRQ